MLGVTSVSVAGKGRSLALNDTTLTATAAKAAGSANLQMPAVG